MVRWPFRLRSLLAPGLMSMLAVLVAGGGAYPSMTGYRQDASVGVVGMLADSGCPSGYTCEDIGGAAPGYETATSGVLTVDAAGYRVLPGTTDQFRLIVQQVTGDLQVSTEILSQSMQGGGWGPEAGLMVRQTADPKSPFYAILEAPEDNPEKEPMPTMRIWARTCYGCSAYEVNRFYPTPLPFYVMVQRQGNIFTAAMSSDGTAWHLLSGSLTEVSLSSQVLAGIAQNSGISGTLGTASYANLALGGISVTPSLPSSKHPCPSGWGCQDIGDTSPTGDQIYANGAISIYGAGSDINGSIDRFHFVWRDMPGSGSISAYMSGQQDTTSDTKDGLMLRQSTFAGAPYYGLFVTPGNGIFVQYRAADEQGTTETAKQSGKAPLWIRISRQIAGVNAAFSAYTSTDGTNWTLLPSSTVTLPLTGTLLAGLAGNAHYARVLSSASFENIVFDGVALTPQISIPTPGSTSGPTATSTSLTAIGCLPSWTCMDVGSAAPAGSQQASGDTWRISGGGADIGGSADQFHFVASVLTGNGSIGARLNSQTGTDPWAKVGVMLRATSDPGSPYFAALVTPGHGNVIQYRTEQGGLTHQVIVAGNVPAYLRITRSGTTLVAYSSPDGLRWTAIAGSRTTLSHLPVTLLAGLAVTSHHVGVLNTATVSAITLVRDDSNNSGKTTALLVLVVAGLLLMLALIGMAAFFILSRIRAGRKHVVISSGAAGQPLWLEDSEAWDTGVFPSFNQARRVQHQLFESTAHTPALPPSMQRELPAGDGTGPLYGGDIESTLPTMVPPGSERARLRGGRSLWDITAEIDSAPGMRTAGEVERPIGRPPRRRHPPPRHP